VTVITNKPLPMEKKKVFSLIKSMTVLEKKKDFFADQINDGFPTEPLANDPHQ
jgi:hypothetical protein